MEIIFIDDKMCLYTQWRIEEDFKTWAADIYLHDKLKDSSRRRLQESLWLNNVLYRIQIKKKINIVKDEKIKVEVYVNPENLY
jgi:predicted methyltransferase